MRKLLIFDLNETFVHTTTKPFHHPADFECLGYFVLPAP